ncbi:MAG: type IV secretory system conjugative DNA transfer family protein [Pseudonocardia sp.]
MADLIWFDVFPPRGLQLRELTGLVRVLAGRPRLGLQRLTPVVVFELHVTRRGVFWQLGIDQRMSASLPAELTAQLPGLNLVRRESSVRPELTTAREVRYRGLAFPLRHDTAASVAAGLYQLHAQLAVAETAVVQWVVGPSNDRRRHPADFTPLVALGLARPVPVDGERQAWTAKIAEPLFGVRGRIGVQVSDPRRAAVLLRSLLVALSLASGAQTPLTAGPQSSRTARQMAGVIGRARTWSSIVSASELAVLLGWPVDGAELPGAGAAFAPVPAALLVDDESATRQPERLLGRSLHPASSETLVALPVQASLSHLHVIGPTGAGKSTLLANLILADAAAGRTVVVIEPKGDLVTDVLARLPRVRQDEVVVIEPGDGRTVVGVNPLAGPADQAERRADELLALFRELFGAAIGPRSADVLLHALITAARLPDGTVTDLPVLLTSAAFRRQALAQVSDPLVLAPFWAAFEAYSDSERAHVVAPLMNKLRVFTTRAAIRRMLGQANPTLTLDELFSERRIVLVNLNRGLLGPETARLLGALLLSQLWRAIQRRAAEPQRQRVPAMVVVDEWQDYLGALDFGDVLSTSRGLGVGWTVSHQHLGQLSPGLQAAVLANARSRLAFRPAQKDAAALSAVLGAGVTPDELERLDAYQAVARVLVTNSPSAAFAVATPPLAATASSGTRLRRRSAARFGVDGKALDAELQARWQGGSGTPGTAGSIGVTRRRKTS